MMFLYFVSFLGLSFGAMAQENALFPELAKKAPEPTPAAAEVVPAGEVKSLFDDRTDKNARQEAVERLQQGGLDEIKAEIGVESLDKNLAAGAAAQQAAAESEKPVVGKGNFVSSPSSVQIIEPSVARFQFCLAYLTLKNNTKTPLTDLSITIDYTPIKMPIQFGGVQPGESATQKIYMATEACQMLTKVPDMTINNCQATGMTEEECKAAVKYITDLQLVSDTRQ